MFFSYSRKRIFFFIYIFLFVIWKLMKLIFEFLRNVTIFHCTSETGRTTIDKIPGRGGITRKNDTILWLVK